MDEVLAGLSILSSLAGGLFGQKSDEAQKQQIKLQEKEQELTATDQTIQRQTQMQSILSAQQASFGSRGLQPSSASFQAITRQSFNDFAQDQQLANLETKLRIEDLKQQRKNINTAQNLGLLKTGLDVGTDLATAFEGRKGSDQGQNQLGIPLLNQ